MLELKGYDYLLVFLLVCSLVPIAALGLSAWIRPKGTGPERRTNYESGMEPL
ncbi:MAG: NAD(P)H-quinone oxidoreductase subunit 3, partial [Gloeomargarita sp. GMQP_bins_14]